MLFSFVKEREMLGRIAWKEMFYSLKGGQEKSPFSVSRDALVPFIAIHEHPYFSMFVMVEKHCVVLQKIF